MKQKIYFHLNLNCSYNDMEKRSAVNQGKGFIRPWVTDDLFKVILLSAKKKKQRIMILFTKLIKDCP